MIDPKGDQMLRGELIAAAERSGARFIEWTPEGPTAYNPYANGPEIEIAEKALSGEVLPSPATCARPALPRHAVRAMHTADIAVTPVSLIASLSPRELELFARSMPRSRRGRPRHIWTH